MDFGVGPRTRNLLPFIGVVGDVRKLPFDANTFDVVLDKGRGTLPIPLLHLTLYPRDVGFNDDNKRRRLGNYN